MTTQIATGRGLDNYVGGIDDCELNDAGFMGEDSVSREAHVLGKVGAGENAVLI
jgi:hypothetical protein